MKKQIFISLLILCVSVPTFAQNKIDVVFNEKHHDFGSVREEDGKVTTIFTFTNTSQQPISIKNVRASCGCTTPTYSREPIMPNGEGKITVAYGAEGRPGTFNKTITVQLGTDADTRTETLSIGGQVLAKAKSAEESFPYKIGGLMFREKSLNFGSIVKGAAVEKIIEVYNNTDGEQTLTFANVPACVSLSMDNAGKIAPKQKTAVKAVFYSDKSKNWGEATEKIQLKIDGKPVSEYVLNAVLVEDFSKMSAEQLKNAPAAVMNPKNLNLTTIKIGSKRTSKVTLANNGNSPLIIRAVKSDVDYLKVAAAKTEVPAGKSIVLNVSVDASKLDVFKFKKQIQIITNDPANSVITLNVEWQTEK